MIFMPGFKVKSGIGGNDAFTKLLLHLNGANGSTTFTDSSTSAHSFSVGNGSPVISTAVSKFGGSSLSSPTSALITTPDGTDFDFGTGDFTIDFCVARKAVSGVRENFFGQSNSGLTGNYQLGYFTTGNKFTFGMNNETFNPTTAGTIADTSFHHIAIVRSSTNLMVALDGTFGTPVGVSTTAYLNSAGSFGIGAPGAYTGSSFGNCNLNEFRVSKGIARWTSNFTPPTQAYS